MINNSKVKLMTKLAVYEKKHKEDIEISKYSKSDYVRLNLIKNVLSVTVAYILVLVIVGLYQIEYLIANAVTLDYKSLGVRILGFYAISVIVFVLAGLLISSQRYSKAIKRLNKYLKRLKILKKYYDEQEEKKGTL
ncbi:MAG: hypothetical protein IJD02_01735 [Lachnospiraceae bacterium]|nr:hypothetical protein [Lachnospiraceae bacterium]